MLARDSILISLSPSSLRVAMATNSEVTRVERVSLDTLNFDEAWEQGLCPLDDALRGALRSIGARPGANAQVLYHSPRVMSEVFVAPATGPAAMQAARMHLGQSLPDGGQGWSMHIHPIVQLAEPGAAKRQVLILSADTATNQNILAQWLSRCGLRPASIAPSRAILLEHAMRAEQHDTGPVVNIHFDEHAMTLCGWVDRRLVFARCADVGYALMIDALKRAARSSTGELPPRDYAARLLFTSGIPVRGQVVDPSRGLLADAVMPLVQPALQRCVIEVRQTLRFGLQEQDIVRAAIHFSGPGSIIPGMTKAFADHLECDLATEQLAAGPNSGVADDQVGDLAIAVQHRDSALWTVPPCERARVENRRLTLCVRAGAAVAVLLLGAMWGSTRRASASTQAELAELEPKAARLAHIISLQEKTAADGVLISQNTALIDSALGRHTSWLGALALAPQDKNSGLTILSVEGSRSKEAGAPPVLTIHARVSSEGAPGSDAATAFVESLTTSPLVASARVVSARNDTEGGECVMEVTLASLPASLPIIHGESRVQERAKP
ncbi:MAG TPA: hypothetical protein VHN77_05970 [Phycisphaerales bacterium]|nr:hypothetical protein [Phycisphaerales bacterium]